MSGGSDDTSEFGRMSTRKLAILFGLAFFGAFMVIQMVQGFPLATLLTRQTTSEQVSVLIKSGTLCVVEASDGQPKEIPNCTYEQGDLIIITFYHGSTNVESHRPA
ncbi:MAG TPA: hypothetical protein VJL54_04005 [Nitrososphaera sp.]|nr:hypothetical protein [Nitrososphaera sp.]HKX81397.1 hypothetical protein [Nitrososphaera sp.]